MANIVMPPCDAGVVRSATAASPCPGSSQPYVLAVTILGSSMVFIDGTVVNVALPALQADMNASVVDVQWVVEISCCVGESRGGASSISQRLRELPRPAQSMKSTRSLRLACALLFGPVSAPSPSRRAT